MKNAFYLILKALFALKIFKLLSGLIQINKNSLIRKIRLISKFVTSQPGQQMITIHALLNISRSKDNQTMKFGQVIEYTKRNIFFKIMQNMRQGD